MEHDGVDIENNLDWQLLGQENEEGGEDVAEEERHLL